MRQLVLLIFLMAAQPASADSPQDTFARLTACAKHEASNECRGDVTRSSLPLYDRFSSYGLIRCLPKDATIISTAPGHGQYMILRAKTVYANKPRVMRFAYREEEGNWKLDIPESLRMSMGQNWEDKVNFTEQLYHIIHQQNGGALTCQAIQQLAQR